MTRTTDDIQAEIIAAQAGIATAQARLTDLEIELADLEAELADLEADLEDDRLNAMAAAAHDLLDTTHHATDSGVIAREFNEALEVWGGDYANLLSYLFMFRDGYHTEINYLLANHPAR